MYLDISCPFFPVPARPVSSQVSKHLGFPLAPSITPLKCPILPVFHFLKLWICFVFFFPTCAWDISSLTEDHLLPSPSPFFSSVAAVAVVNPMLVLCLSSHSASFHHTLVASLHFECMALHSLIANRSESLVNQHFSMNAHCYLWTSVSNFVLTNFLREFPLSKYLKFWVVSCLLLDHCSDNLPSVKLLDFRRLHFSAGHQAFFPLHISTESILLIMLIQKVC